MNTIKEARIITIILFLAISLGMIWLFLIGFQSGVFQPIQDLSRGLIHRTLILNVSLTLITVAGILLWYEKLRLQDIGIIPGKLPFALTCGISAWAIVQGIEAIAGLSINGHTGFVADWNQNSLAIIGLLIGNLLGTALWEEIAFRGFLLKQCFLRFSRRIESKSRLVISSIFVSQLVFMLFHIPWKLLNFESYSMLLGELAGILFTGILYAILYWRTDNLFLVMIIHALGNAPTPLVTPVIGTNNLLVLFMLFLMAFWPKIMKWDKEQIVKPI